jgi:methyl-accepting chemotaxis protein
MFLAILGWACTVSLLLLAMLFDLQNELLTVLFSAALNIVPTYYAHREHYDLQVGASLGIGAAIQPALLVFMLQGHPWQMEGHMYFFAGLAALTLVCDWRPIAVAVGVIAVHHLLLSYLAPEWVFIGSGDLARVMVHALAVSLVLAVLGPVMVHMSKLIVEQSNARATSEGSAAAALAALETAKQAQAEVETERE